MGVILPKLTYGAEIYGMNKALTNMAQTRLNRALRATCGGKYQSPSLGLWGECKVPSICAITVGHKVRGSMKSRILRSHVNDLVRHPLRYARWNWLSNTRRWLNTFGKKYDTRLETWETITDPKQLRAIVQNAVQAGK